jgi:GNAT superfamily N-acetyltransferase
MIVLRPARPEDRQAVDDLASQIWDGDDYVTDCFDDWVTDPHGRFTVALAGETLVGFGKLTRLNAREWWLEGLRVDPAWRGQGIARLLHEEAIRTADRIAQGILRFATSSKNAAVHKIALDSGFHHISDHLLVELPLTTGGDFDGSSGELTPVTPGEAEALAAWLAASDHYSACGGLLEDGWQWLEIIPQLASLLERGKVFWWTTGRSTCHSGVVILDRPNKAGNLRFNYINVPAGDWPLLTAVLRDIASQFSTRLIKGKPLALSGLATILGAAGWEVEDDIAMRVFARQIRNQLEIKE